MDVSELSQAKIYLLEHATDPMLCDELKDMLLCNPRIIAREISSADYEILSQYIPLPRSRNGSLNKRGAEQELINLLNSCPAFRSQNASAVCLAIATYFETHPDEIKVAATNIPAWSRNLPSSPRHSPVGSPRASPRASPPPQQELPPNLFEE